MQICWTLRGWFICGYDNWGDQVFQWMSLNLQAWGFDDNNERRDSER